MNTPTEIFRELENGIKIKNGLCDKGMFEQNRINERFYRGDQWHGTSAPGSRPLVTHNVIRRIGIYKFAKLFKNDISLEFLTGNKKLDGAFNENYRKAAARLRLNGILQELLKSAYIRGTGILYTLWDPNVKSGVFADSEKKTELRGDIRTEILNIDDVFFGDPRETDINRQPYILIFAKKRSEEIYGISLRSKGTVRENRKAELADTVTKLFMKNGTIHGITVTENEVVRPEWDTGLSRYPLAVFRWENRNGSAYGDSEVTYLVPNQIAINRMMTASTWATMTMGMPIMAVNGDTVTEEITNEPGQIIRIYGTNEDVEGAVRYITPPDFSDNFEVAVSSLIDNTLKSAGISSAALGDYEFSNAAAIEGLKNSTDECMTELRVRFTAFLSDVGLIFADYWSSMGYGYGIPKDEMPQSEDMEISVISETDDVKENENEGD